MKYFKKNQQIDFFVENYLQHLLKNPTGARTMDEARGRRHRT
jgi:pantoate kinase